MHSYQFHSYPIMQYITLNQNNLLHSISYGVSCYGLLHFNVSDELKAFLLPAQPSSPSWSSSSSSFRSSCLRMDGRFTTSPRGPPGGRPSGPTPPWGRENLARSQKKVKEVNQMTVEANISSISTQLSANGLTQGPHLGLGTCKVPVDHRGVERAGMVDTSRIKMQPEQKGYECIELINQLKFQTF